MSSANFQVEGQDQTPEELLVSNSRQVIQDVLQHIENNETCGNIVDYATYKIDWLISLILRFASSFNREERLLELLQEARRLLIQLENDIQPNNLRLPNLDRSSQRGRPRFHIAQDQLELLLDYGLKASDIAKMLCVSEKTIYRRLKEFGILVRDTYSDINDTSLDISVRNICQQFPNCGYKMMRGHLLSKDIKIQEYRVRESMRRVDPDGIVIRALQLKVTHRRVYNVRGPLALWHMDGNHKLIRLERRLSAMASLVKVCIKKEKHQPR